MKTDFQENVFFWKISYQVFKTLQSLSPITDSLFSIAFVSGEETGLIILETRKYVR